MLNNFNPLRTGFFAIAGLCATRKFWMAGACKLNSKVAELWGDNLSAQKWDQDSDNYWNLGKKDFIRDLTVVSGVVFAVCFAKGVTEYITDFKIERENNNTKENNFTKKAEAEDKNLTNTTTAKGNTLGNETNNTVEFFKESNSSLAEEDNKTKELEVEEIMADAEKTTVKANNENGQIEAAMRQLEVFGINSKAEGINTWLKDKTKEPVDLATLRVRDNFELYLARGAPNPIKITWEEAFQFVIDKVKQAQTDIIPMSFQEFLDYQIFNSLTNIEIKNPPEGIHSQFKGYVSWFDMICKTLQDIGYIQECGRQGATMLIYR